jgi:hypothetical protein
MFLIHFFADAVAKKNVLSVTLPKIVDVKTLIETQISCIAPETSAAVSTEPSSPPPSKKRKSLFDFLDGIPSEMQESKNELEDYLKYSKTAQEQPLAFWRLNGTRFPLLAKLAQRHLAMPATSGSVERLFSIAGAICRSRRASLSIITTEKLLLCQNYLYNFVKD